MESPERIEQTSLEIKERFAKVNVQLQEKDIITMLTPLINKFRVPLNEAARNVTNKLLKVHNVNADEFFAAAGFANQAPVKIADLKEDNKWVTFGGKVTILWEPRHEKILQTGVIGDETGTVVFTTWKKSNAPVLEEGKCYTFKNVVTSDWQGKISIKVNKNSEITPFEGDIKVSKNLVTIVGAMVDLQQGSGLIKRCPECNRSLVKGACGEHGKVEGVYDLRIKAIIDDGNLSQEVILNRELTEALTGITLERAKEIAMESMDSAAVADEMRKMLTGRYFEVKGVRIERNLIADSIIPYKADVTSQLSGLLAAVEA
jgi:replication factor A1